MNSNVSNWLTLFNTALIIVLLIFVFKLNARVPAAWMPVANPAKTTIHLNCGEDSTVYTNTGSKEELLIFQYDNNCEFTAYAYKENRDSVSLSSLSIPGRTLKQASFELKPGERFVCHCSLVSTIENKGCDVTRWIAATR